MLMQFEVLLVLTNHHSHENNYAGPRMIAYMIKVYHCLLYVDPYWIINNACKQWEMSQYGQFRLTNIDKVWLTGIGPKWSKVFKVYILDLKILAMHGAKTTKIRPPWYVLLERGRKCHIVVVSHKLSCVPITQEIWSGFKITKQNEPGVWF